MFARTTNPLNQPDTFDELESVEPFSIPSGVSEVCHAIIPFGRSAAKAAPAIPPVYTNKSADGFASGKRTAAVPPHKFICTMPPLSHLMMFPLRHAPVPTPPSLHCPADPDDSARPRRASCADAPAEPATRRPSRWERRQPACKRIVRSVDHLLADPTATAAPPPPGTPGCRSRYNFQIGLALAVDELRRARWEAAAAPPCSELQ
jgi:hypothetical protein